MPDDDLEDLIESSISRALVLRDTAKSDEEWEELWSLLRRLRPLRRVAFERALALLQDADDRALGCDLLGVLCDPDEEEWSHEAAEALVRTAEGEEDIGIVWSIAAAFNHVSDPLGVPVLARYARHSDREIRLLVAQGITSCRTHEDGESVQDICNVLIPLTEDVDGDVRDWATFGLGHQLESDGPEVRRALVNRLNDEHGDTHWEAVLGLARRHDHRAFDFVMEGILGDSVPKLAVWSAAWLGDARLFPALEELKSWWTHWKYPLENALEQCDPNEQERRWANEELFLKTFDEAVRAGRVPVGHGVAISSPCVGISEGDVDIDLIPDPLDGRGWSLHHLIDVACEGDAVAAVEKVIQEINERTTESKGDGVLGP
jgi:hypothetical protein